MTQSPLELEAVNSAAELLKGYDPVTDQWKFSRDSDFWKAIKHAHDIGFRGKGQRVAIIDSECDLNIPRLARQVGKVRKLVVGTEGPKSHGTAVAMLISEVAPDCILDIYSVVADDESVDEAATLQAIAEATPSGATVINLSMGKPQQWVPHEDPTTLFWGDVRDRKRREISEQDPCALCQAASKAAELGKLVFAAVGNDRFQVYCPARAKQVVAVGFQQYQTARPAPDKEITSLAPVSDQAIHADLMLLTVPGALGSSFACPLYAGVGALGVTQAELWQFIASYSERVFPMMFHAQVDTRGGVANAPADLVDVIEKGYWRSLSLLPHAHCEVQFQRYPNLPRSDPKTCPFCGIFAHLQYINLGYWLFGTKRVPEAINLLQAARALCPWDSRPVAFEGSAYYAIGLLDRAVENYELAVRMRPGYQPYIDALKYMRLEAGRGLVSVVPSPGSLAPELATMPFLNLTRRRQRLKRKENLFYYVATGVVLALHLTFPPSILAKGMVVLLAIIGLIFSALSFRDARLSSVQASVVPDYGTRREVYRLTRLLRISTVCYFAAFIGLLIALTLT